MLSLPAAKLLPLTTRTAVPALPDTATLAFPNRVLPIVNDTFPAGTPDAAFTVAVRTVTELCTIAAGLAVTAVLVTIAGGETMTTTGADTEPLKLLLPP